MGEVQPSAGPQVRENGAREPSLQPTAQLRPTAFAHAHAHARLYPAAHALSLFSPAKEGPALCPVLRPRNVHAARKWVLATILRVHFTACTCSLQFCYLLACLLACLHLQFAEPSSGARSPAHMLTHAGYMVDDMPSAPVVFHVGAAYTESALVYHKSGNLISVGSQAIDVSGGRRLGSVREAGGGECPCVPTEATEGEEMKYDHVCQSA